jgi:hypothetical protein
MTLTTASRPFWQGTLDDRIARLERTLSEPAAAGRDEDALRLALTLLHGLRAEESVTARA